MELQSNKASSHPQSHFDSSPPSCAPNTCSQTATWSSNSDVTARCRGKGEQLKKNISLLNQSKMSEEIKRRLRSSRLSTGKNFLLFQNRQTAPNWAQRRLAVAIRCSSMCMLSRGFESHEVIFRQATTLAPAQPRFSTHPETREKKQGRSRGRKREEKV